MIKEKMNHHVTVVGNMSLASMSVSRKVWRDHYDVVYEILPPLVGYSF